jgi:hypothetical protein
LHLRVPVAGLLAALLLGGTAASAAAHTPDPGYRSIVEGITPNTPGLTVQVLGFDNQLKITNETGKTVEIEGYEHDPYVLMLPNGTVEVNQNSPATYSNEDRFAVTPIPKFATAKAAKDDPNWKVVGHGGQFIWHDHRMHWMSHTLPPDVHDKHVKTKVFNYQVPLKVNGKTATITGELFWVGIPKSSPVVWFAVLAVVAVLGLLFVRWRRKANGELSDDEPEGNDDLREAW